MSRQAGQPEVCLRGEDTGVMQWNPLASHDRWQRGYSPDHATTRPRATGLVMPKLDRNRYRLPFLKSLALRLHMARLLGPLTLEQLTYLVENGSIRNCKAGESVISAGSISGYHLVVLEGEVEVQHCGHAGNGISRSSCSRLSPAGIDGGVAFMNAPARPFSATAITDARCLLIDTDSADKLLGWYPQLTHLKRVNPRLWQRASQICNVSLFYRVPPYRLEDALHCLVPREAAAGETVISAGEAADYYYAIEEGHAEAWCTDPLTGRAECVAELGPGDAFGEEVSLQADYQMSVKMRTSGTLLALSRTDFEALSARDVHVELSAESVRVLVDTREARLLDCRSYLELQESRIPGAIAIPLDRLNWELHTLDTDVTYVVCCRNGLRSRVAAHLLRTRHIQAHPLAGGLNTWPYALKPGRAELHADAGQALAP